MNTGRGRTQTERLSGPKGELVPVSAEAVEGPGAGAKADLSSGTLVIGSDRACDLVVNDRSVSRRHATVELLPGAVRVRDLESRNGTVYLGARIDQARVPVGGSIRVGRTTVRFSPRTEERQPSQKTALGALIGESLPMRRLFAVLERLGPKDSSVLIHGESGAGKEAVARALHELSPRAKRGFVIFDCASINPNLVESELFGHVKGAFTGADRTRAGAFEEADQGTLLLDEVGALPLELQSKLLRALESGEFKRIGENVTRLSDFRVLATTQKDLEADSRQGRFRSDLYYRLAVATVEVPPLRERAEDIPVLASRFARELSGVTVELAPSTLAALQCDPWPGNVRELRNAVERVVTLGQIEESPPPPSRGSGGRLSFAQMRRQLLERFERDYLVSLLARQRNNVSAAAREAKLSRSQFYRLLRRRGLAFR